jgi:A/G-specific adenine glycosylase
VAGEQAGPLYETRGITQAQPHRWAQPIRQVGPDIDPQPLRAALLAWFDRHKRDLPWRRTRDPYAIWVSEVMLQQTRVAAVLEHYARWTERFPTVAALAEAGEPEVLALWSGLGYYRRARFLHAGARAVMSEHGGKVPTTAAALRGLPGIGEYTSAAIASIAFGEPVAVVDGNVERVVTRLAGLAIGHPPAGQPEVLPVEPAQPGQDRTVPIEPGQTRVPLGGAIRAIAGGLLAPTRPGDWNQAMMELGATVCLPRAPLCLHCPVQRWCATRGEHAAAPRKAMRTRRLTYALVERERDGDREVLLAQRPAGASLMADMWELPEIAELPEAAAPILTVRHAITDTNYTVRVVGLTLGEAAALGITAEGVWVAASELPETALTGLARKVLKRLALWPAEKSQPAFVI